MIEQVTEPLPEELRAPYIRLRVDYAGGYSVIAPRHFARHMEGKIANPADCVLFFKSAKGGGSATQATHRTKSLAQESEDDELPNNNRQSLGH